MTSPTNARFNGRHRRAMPNGDVVECSGAPTCRHCLQEQTIGFGPRTVYVDQVESVRMEGNPEDSVISDIDALIDEQLAAGDQSREWTQPLSDECPNCRGEWHGLPKRDWRGVVYCQGSIANAESPSDLSESEPLTRVWDSDMNEIVGGPCVIHGIPFQWPPDDDGTEDFSRAFLVPAAEYGALTIAPMFESVTVGFDRLDRLMRNVLAMLAEVCGVHLPETDIDGAADALEQVTREHMQQRERDEAMQRERLTHDAAAPDGYTSRDIDEMRREMASARNRKALQGLRSRSRDDGQTDSETGAGDEQGRESSAGAAMCDASSNGEETQEDSGA